MKTLVAVGLVACFTPGLFAHHSFRAEFDATKPLRLHGTVVRVEWVNPHAWVYLDVRGDDGRVTTWAVECPPPQSLARRGWRAAQLPPGTEITVEGYAARSGEPTVNGRAITLPDGTRRPIDSDISGTAGANTSHIQ